jgi:ankyrin repeat protein
VHVRLPACRRGVAPLHVAAREGQLPALELLVSKGANLEMKDGHGWTALQASASLM